LREFCRLCEDIADQYSHVAARLGMRYFNKRAVICAGLLSFRLEVHRLLALTADHLAISGVMGISISVTSPAARNCNVNGLVRGALDNELHSLSRSARLEKVQLRRSQLALVHVEILVFGYRDNRDVALLW